MENPKPLLDQLGPPEQGRPWQSERYFLSLEGFE